MELEGYERITGAEWGVLDDREAARIHIGNDVFYYRKKKVFPIIIETGFATFEIDSIGRLSISVDGDSVQLERSVEKLIEAAEEAMSIQRKKVSPGPPSKKEEGAQ